MEKYYKIKIFGWDGGKMGCNYIKRGGRVMEKPKTLYTSQIL